MAARRARPACLAVLVGMALALPAATDLSGMGNTWSKVDVLAILLLCGLLAAHHMWPSKAQPFPAPQPTMVVLCNYPMWAKCLVPALQPVTSRLLLVSNKTELQDFCTAIGCEFMAFPLCADSTSFPRICKEDAAYRAKVEEVYESMRCWAPELMVAAGFHVLPQHAVAIPKEAALNFHPSRLPLYRGGFPFQAQLLRGEKNLECCVHIMTNVIDDARDVLARGCRVSLEGKTTELLFAELAASCPSLILEALRVLRGELPRPPAVPQWGELPHAFGVQTETWMETGQKQRSNSGVLARVRIEWDEDTALDIERACRAFKAPGQKTLFSDYQGEPCGIRSCLILDVVPPPNTPPGTVLFTAEEKRCACATVDGAAVLLTLDDAAPEVVTGGKFESVTLVSSWLQKPFTDRVRGGKRFE